jgi:hypothetical protein
MDSVDNSWCNFTYRGPRPDIGDLRVECEMRENGDRVVRAFWKPTADELEQLQRGGTIVSPSASSFHPSLEQVSASENGPCTTTSLGPTPQRWVDTFAAPAEEAGTSCI